MCREAAAPAAGRVAQRCCRSPLLRVAVDTVSMRRPPTCAQLQHCFCGERCVVVSWPRHDTRMIVRARRSALHLLWSIYCFRSSSALLVNSHELCEQVCCSTGRAPFADTVPSAAVRNMHCMQHLHGQNSHTKRDVLLASMPVS